MSFNSGKCSGFTTWPVASATKWKLVGWEQSVCSVDLPHLSLRAFVSGRVHNKLSLKRYWHCEVNTICVYFNLFIFNWELFFAIVFCCACRSTECKPSLSHSFFHNSLVQWSRCHQPSCCWGFQRFSAFSSWVARWRGQHSVRLHTQLN